MHVPFAVFAIHPADRCIAQARDEVIAPRVVAIPPARLDALRSCKRAEFPFTDFLRFEKPNWPRSRRGGLTRVPLAGLDAAPGMFRTVIGLRRESVYRLGAEARAQPLDQARPIFGFERRIAEHAGARTGERREIAGFEHDRLDGLREHGAREALAQYLSEAFGVARGGGEPDFHAGGAALLEEKKTESVHAFVPRGEQPLELHEQAPRAEVKPLGVRHFRGKLELVAEARRRREERARLGRSTERAVDRLERLRSAALRKTVARQAKEPADRGHADASQEFDIDAGHFHRKRFQPLALSARAPERGARGARHAERKWKVHFGETGSQLLAQPRKTAVQAQAPPHFEDELARRLERNLRRELAGPCADRRERLCRQAREVQCDPKHGKVS